MNKNSHRKISELKMAKTGFKNYRFDVKFMENPEKYGHYHISASTKKKRAPFLNSKISQLKQPTYTQSTTE
ncbi:hypothetical protein AYI68_g7302 [Smittium mucronatum]|uniref:Uncharacterized protein n=1 Tax=Smittium mucronatum TaxID=133383 RepID=A0A1R0GP48_9FUNG|nr:hypothetical protein AYI68_g7302 [Smittium mucronatum]